MKFWGIFRFELAYQARRAWPWMIAAVLLVVSFLMTRDASLSEALHDDFFVNSPFAIAKTTVAGSLIWLLIGAFVAGEAAARDVATRMHPLTWSVPVTKTQYLGGRFLAAFTINAAILLAVQLGIALAVYLPGFDAAIIGPFRIEAYLTAFAFLTLPNAFFATALQFALATRSGRPMAAYLGSVLLFVMSYVVSMFMTLQGRQDLANLLDPIGVHFILSELSHLWTSTEKSWRLVTLEGTVLTNRLLWTSIGALSLAITWLRFRFAHRAERSKSRRRDAHAPARTEPSARIVVPDVPRAFGFGIHVRRTLAIARVSFTTLAKSWAGLAMLIPLPLLSVAVILDQMEMDGVSLAPTTALVVKELTGPVSADPLAQEMSRWVIIPLLLVFFAGELVWRERDAGIGEITDALPGSEWSPFLGKFLGIAMLLTLFTTLLMGSGIAAQAIRGHHDFQLGLYLKTLFGLQLPEYLLFAVVALAIHVVVNQKYVAHLVAIMAYAYIAAASLFGIEHNLLIYSASPNWSYTDMRGFGVSLAPWLSFKLYWAAWALLIAVIARVLWVRGKETRFRVRLDVAKRRFARPTMMTAVVAIALIVIVGGFVFYNTNVLNDYVTSTEAKASRAEYERRFGRYASAPQPRLAGTKLHVEIDPDHRKVDIRGTYRLVNRTAAPIDAIHLAPVRRVDTRGIAFDRPATLVVNDPSHRVYALAKPLQPNESLRLDFQVIAEPRGFRNSGADGAITPAAVSFLNGDWLPAIGYQRDRELTNAADRREYNLPPRPEIASLYNANARHERGGATELDVVIGTRADQTAVAPGELRRAWTERGRRYFHYATSAPIGNVYAIVSARYAVAETRWNDVALRIFHAPEHTGHLERIKSSAKASLDYYTAQFGPYPYRHLTFVEHPGAPGAGMHADPAMITHGESFPFWAPREKGGLDLPWAVVAHELAHQWTVPSAFVEGAPVLSESLAWYYALKVFEHARGTDDVRGLLAWMRQPHRYPPIRRGEPLLRGLDPYMSYRRGPFALYALSEFIGTERVNTALRRMLASHRPDTAPLATTLDLYRELHAVTPNDRKYLLRDLFEVNTFWQLAVDKATAKQTTAGTWDVTLAITAKKMTYDQAGVERESPMDEPIEIGLFDDAPPDRPELSAAIYLQKHRIRSGAQTITINVPRKPVYAGVDPFHVLDWEEQGDDDNVSGVKVTR